MEGLAKEDLILKGFMRFLRNIPLWLPAAIFLFTATIAWTAEYEISVHPSAPVGGDVLLLCQPNEVCGAKIDMIDLAPLLVQGEIRDGYIALSFYQNGVRLPVKMRPGSRLMAHLSVPEPVFDTSVVVNNQVHVYANDAVRKPIYQGMPEKKGIVYPVIVQPGAQAITVETTIRRIKP